MFGDSVKRTSLSLSHFTLFFIDQTTRVFLVCLIRIFLGLICLKQPGCFAILIHELSLQSYPKSNFAHTANVWKFTFSFGTNIYQKENKLSFLLLGVSRKKQHKLFSWIRWIFLMESIWCIWQVKIYFFELWHHFKKSSLQLLFRVASSSQ